MKKILLPLLLLPLLVGAQNIEKLEKKAEKHFYTEGLYEALSLYNQILKIDPKHRIAKYRVEICSLLTTHRAKPIDRIAGYAKTQGRKDKFYGYWMGRIHFSQNHFKKAIKSWKAFLALKKYKSKEIIAETEGLIKWAELAETSYSHPENFEIEHLPSNINSTSTEYSPVYFKEKKELLYLSSIQNSIVENKEESFKVYQSLREGESWSQPQVIEKFGSFIAVNANIEVVANDGKLFLYKDDNKGSLYYSELESGEWTDLDRFDSHLTGKTMDSHFFINEHEDRILFAAPAKKGAYENLDIFESVKNPATGKWAAPTVFSININSPESEDYPYLTEDDKTLYFSSRGHNSIGGYDVFKSVYDDNTATWSKPESLNYPVNTQDDDIQFKMDSESQSGYFVSDRFESEGSYDIFFFHESNKINIEGIVRDGSGKPVDHGILVFTPERKTNVIAKISTNEEGYYKLRLGTEDRYKVEISFHDEIVHRDVIETSTNAGNVLITKNFDLIEEKEALVVEENHQNDPRYTDLENIGSKFRHSNKAVLHNVYFEFDSYQLSNEAILTLETLFVGLKEYPELSIEISGHTDNVGPKEVNMKISGQRANAVRDHLISKGIKGNRLRAVGYGETKPIASNDDEINGRDLNRRIEVMVLE